MNKAETTKIYSLFAAVVQNARDMDKTAVSLLLEVWHAVLADLSFATAQAAAITLLSTRTVSVLPQPGEIKQAAVGKYINSLPTAVEAWRHVAEALAKHGEYEASNIIGALWFSNPVAAATVEAIGAKRLWWETASICIDNQNAMRREWEREYGNQIKREREVLTERGELEKRLSATRIPKRQPSPGRALPPVREATLPAGTLPLGQYPAMTEEERDRSNRSLEQCKRRLAERWRGRGVASAGKASCLNENEEVQP